MAFDKRWPRKLGLNKSIDGDIIKNPPCYKDPRSSTVNIDLSECAVQ